MTDQKIDTIKMTRSIRDRNYERLRHLTPAERLAFYREQTAMMNAKATALVKAETPRSSQS